MKKSKNGMGRAANSPKRQWKGVTRAKTSEVAASPRIIGYTVWDNQHQRFVKVDGAVITIGSEQFAEEAVSQMDMASRFEIRETRCSMVFTELAEGHSYLLMPDVDTGFGEKTMPEIIAFFGDPLGPSPHR